jgi:hypothetical protein
VGTDFIILGQIPKSRIAGCGLGSLVCLRCLNKTPQTEWLANQRLVSHSSGGRKDQGCRCWEVVSAPRPPLLAYKKVLPHCVLTWTHFCGSAGYGEFFITSCCLSIHFVKNLGFCIPQAQLRQSFQLSTSLQFLKVIYSGTCIIQLPPGGQLLWDS